MINFFNHSFLLTPRKSLHNSNFSKIGKMFKNISLICVAILVARLADAQNKGTNTQESTLSLPYETCTASGCTSQQGGVTMDGNWRWTHKVNTT